MLLTYDLTALTGSYDYFKFSWLILVLLETHIIQGMKTLVYLCIVACFPSCTVSGEKQEASHVTYNALLNRRLVRV